MCSSLTRLLAAAWTGRLAGALLALAVGLWASAPSDAGAQFALRSKIEGTLTDSTGAVLPGATVTLTETTRNQVQTATTDSNGIYSFSNLAPGTYTVVADLTGFVKTSSEPVTLGSATTTRVDLTLSVGASESVQVVKETPLLHTDQIAIGVAVDKTTIDHLAAKGRNFTSFVQLAPGISTEPRTDTGGTNSVGAYHVIGGIDYTAGGGGNNGFYINGVNANDNYVGGQSYSPSLEAIDEIKVDVANFSAANGRDLSTLSVTTRAGCQRLSRIGLRLHRELDAQRVGSARTAARHRRHREAVAQPPSVRRQHRRADSQEQAVLLRELRAHLQQARVRSRNSSECPRRPSAPATSAAWCSGFRTTRTTSSTIRSRPPSTTRARASASRFPTTICARSCGRTAHRRSIRGRWTC